jgi:hypothetical protein
MAGSKAALWTCSFLYGLLSVVVVVFAVKTTKCDPTDEVLHIQRKKQEKGEKFDRGDLEYHCIVCDGYVTERAKHCG